MGDDFSLLRRFPARAAAAGDASYLSMTEEGAQVLRVVPGKSYFGRRFLHCGRNDGSGGRNDDNRTVNCARHGGYERDHPLSV
ncbi:hypothetical protein BH20CHL4_BH20CHL4_06210 [soil metagenome]